MVRVWGLLRESSGSLVDLGVLYHPPAQTNMEPHKAPWKKTVSFVVPFGGSTSVNLKP